MAKIRRDESQQVDQVVNGDLTITGNIISPGVSLLQVTIERIKIALNGLRTPVAGEPSLGTWHDIPVGINAYLINQLVVPGTWYTATFSIGTAAGDIPVGTKKVKTAVEMNAAAGAASTMYFRPFGSGLGARVTNIILAADAGKTVGAQADVPVDSSGRCDFTSDQAATIYVTNAIAYLV